jgi:dipeptide/tripeptide permease
MVIIIIMELGANLGSHLFWPSLFCICAAAAPMALILFFVSPRVRFNKKGNRPEKKKKKKNKKRPVVEG